MRKLRLVSARTATPGEFRAATEQIPAPPTPAEVMADPIAHNQKIIADDLARPVKFEPRPDPLTEAIRKHRGGK